MDFKLGIVLNMVGVACRRSVRSRLLLVIACCLIGGHILFTQTAFAEAGKRPNVILCMTDDQGWGDTGYNGHPVLRTPHLDEMAREGMRFERFYSGAPVCSPTRGSCLTARHPYRYGITFANVGRMPQEEVTLAEILQQQGYATGHFGKWHLGTLTTKMKDSNRGRPGNVADYSAPWQNGFDASFSTEAKVPTFWKPEAYEQFGTYYWTGPEMRVPTSEVVGDDSKLIMDRVLPFLRQVEKEEKPFFIVVWFHAPHLPVVSALPYTEGYEEHQDYYGCLTAMDEQMGRLRRELGKLGLDKNTMLWFCSDNGPEGDEKSPGRTGGLRGRKRSLYEGGVRVPGLLVWPERISGGQVAKLPCSTSDYLPTVLDALGLALPEEESRPYDGISLLPLVEGKMTARTKPIGFQSDDQLALIDNRYKIYSADRGESFELYDLQADPEEKNDLAEKQPKVVQTMKETLLQWQESCKASLAGKDY